MNNRYKKQVGLNFKNTPESSKKITNRSYNLYKSNKNIKPGKYYEILLPEKIVENINEVNNFRKKVCDNFKDDKKIDKDNIVPYSTSTNKSSSRNTIGDVNIKSTSFDEIRDVNIKSTNTMEDVKKFYNKSKNLRIGISFNKKISEKEYPQDYVGNSPLSISFCFNSFYFIHNAKRIGYSEYLINEISQEYKRIVFGIFIKCGNVYFFVNGTQIGSYRIYNKKTSKIQKFDQFLSLAVSYFEDIDDECISNFFINEGPYYEYKEKIILKYPKIFG